MTLKMRSFVFIFGSLLGLLSGRCCHIIPHHPFAPRAPDVAATHPHLYLYPVNVLVNNEQVDQLPAAAPPAPPAPPAPCTRPGDSRTRVFTKLFSVPGAVADSLLSGEIVI